MQVVATEYFPNGTSDVSSSLTKVKGRNPDLIVGSVHLVEGVAIIKQSRELGVVPKQQFVDRWRDIGRDGTPLVHLGIPVWTKDAPLEVGRVARVL